jgi:hypothetical protein
MSTVLLPFFILRVEVHFCPEDRDITLLRKVCTCWTDYTESKFSRSKISLFDCRENLGSRKGQQYTLTSNYTRK